MKDLGGTMICHNVLRYDYCVEAAIESLCALCDEVVVLDCYSTDGTTQFLRYMMNKHPHLYMFNAQWDIEKDFHRISRLTNIARDALDSKWHFNLQADEVIHEAAFPKIRKAIKTERSDSFQLTRLNFWGGFHQIIRDDYPNKPVSNYVTRLALRKNNSVRDGESLAGSKTQHLHDAEIYHYGFVRDREIHLDKIIDMQQWFGFGVDQRVVKQKREKGIFVAEDYHPKEAFRRFRGTHPKFAEKWISERRSQWRNK